MDKLDDELINTVNKTMVTEPGLNSPWLWHEGLVRILRWMRVNQETKYCGEVISDDVQLWTETGDMREPNVTGEKHDKNLKI